MKIVEGFLNEHLGLILVIIALLLDALKGLMVNVFCWDFGRTFWIVVVYMGVEILEAGYCCDGRVDY